MLDRECYLYGDCILLLQLEQRAKSDSRKQQTYISNNILGKFLKYVLIQLYNDASFNYFQLIVAYKDFMVKMAMLLGANNKANVIKQMNEVLQFERNVAKIYEPEGKLKDSENIYNKMTIADLQQMAPSVC